MSLGLVSYDSSSSNESDEDENADQPKTDHGKITADESPAELNVGQQLRMSLPPPKQRGNAIKIAAPVIPELDSDDDEDEPQPKKVKSGKNISSLFAMLPQPKHASVKQTNRILIPHTLTKKKAPPPKVPSRPTVTSRAPSAKEEDSDDESDINFFSLGRSDKDGESVPHVQETVGPALGPERPDVGRMQPEVLSEVQTSKPQAQSALLARLTDFPGDDGNAKSTVSKANQSSKFGQYVTKGSDNQEISSYSESSSSLPSKGPQTVHSKLGLPKLDSSKLDPSNLKSSKLVGPSRTDVRESVPGTQSRNNKLVPSVEQISQKPQSKLVSSATAQQPGESLVQPELNEQPLSFSSTKTPYGYQRLSTISNTAPSVGGYSGYDAEAVQYDNSYQQGPYYGQYHQGEPATSSQAPDSSFIADKEFQKMIGKERFDPSSIIDVNADDHMGKVTAEEWMLKSITEERQAREELKKDQLPTSQQKRKHQITYLARQAKERELELKNTWANNRMTRKETQAKYGF